MRSRFPLALVCATLVLALLPGTSIAETSSVSQMNPESGPFWVTLEPDPGGLLDIWVADSASADAVRRAAVVASGSAMVEDFLEDAGRPRAAFVAGASAPHLPDHDMAILRGLARSGVPVISDQSERQLAETLGVAFIDYSNRQAGEHVTVRLDSAGIPHWEHYLPMPAATHVAVGEEPAYSGSASSPTEAGDQTSSDETLAAAIDGAAAVQGPEGHTYSAQSVDRTSGAWTSFYSARWLWIGSHLDASRTNPLEYAIDLTVSKLPDTKTDRDWYLVDLQPHTNPNTDGKYVSTLPFCADGEQGWWTVWRKSDIIPMSPDAWLEDHGPTGSIGSSTVGITLGASLGADASGPGGSISAYYSASYTQSDVVITNRSVVGTNSAGWTEKLHDTYSNITAPGVNPGAYRAPATARASFDSIQAAIYRENPLDGQPLGLGIDLDAMFYYLKVDVTGVCWSAKHYTYKLLDFMTDQTPEAGSLPRDLRIQHNYPPDTPATPSTGTVWVNTPTVISTTATDRDGDSLTYQFDFGDGPVSTFGARQVTHTWTSPGPYSPRVQAKDYHGDVSQWSEESSLFVKGVNSVDVEGPDSVYDSVQLFCRALFNTGEEKLCEPSTTTWLVDSPYASISSSGFLTAYDTGGEERQVGVEATYVDHGLTKSTTRWLTIKKGSGTPPPPPPPPPPVPVEPPEENPDLIVFTSTRNDYQTDTYVMNTDGSGEKRLTYDEAADREPTLSPDGSLVAFRTSRDGNDEIYVIGTNRAGLARLTNNSASDAEPAWSPNGKQIAFVSDRNGNNEIYVMNANGTGQVRLTSNPGSNRSPAWSPDGRKIAFVSDRDGSPQIYVMDADGSDITRLTDNALINAEPAWSPDGRKIAFSSIRPPSVLYKATWEISVMNADGSNQQEVPDDGAYAHRQHPSWTADGSKIIYADGRIGALQIYSVNPDGSKPTRLTTVDGSTEPNAQPARMRAHPVGLVDASKGYWHLFGPDGTETASFYYGNPGDYPFMGDWDCNGIETPGLYRQSDGYAYLRNSNSQGIADIKFYFGNPGDVPIAGDFNGDGCDTVSIYRPSNQTFYIINKLGSNDGGLGAAELSYVFGNPGDKPFVGDFDGDGIETVGLHRESTGLVYFRNSHTQGNADNQFFFGDPGDRLIAGDWNSDGKFSPALFRPSNTMMYFRYTNTQGNADAQFVPNPNGAAWLPVAGTR